jgi:hypothetical protein
MIGEASGSSFSIVGCSMLSGRFGNARLILSRTSWAASSRSRSSSKVTKTSETPSDEVERSSSMPLMVLTASSILSVISVSTSCGAAPGSRVVTVMVGNSTRGKRSTVSRLYEKTPSTISVIMSIVAKTGRRTQISASFCMPFLYVNRTCRTNRTCSICPISPISPISPIEILPGKNFPHVEKPACRAVVRQ